MVSKESESKMQYVFLGNTGLKVSKLALGTMNFNVLKKIDKYHDIFKKAFELGINFIDTAEIYGNEGSSEIITGIVLKILGIKREELVITVKLYGGPDRNSKMAKNSIGLSRKHIIEGMKNSLKRLKLDYADIVFAHRDDHDTPMEETCRAFDWLIRKGYALYWGTSMWPICKIE
jgi:aryl-alcohol dehydrogenase-like predicted oxidoreductase